MTYKEMVDKIPRQVFADKLVGEIGKSSALSRMLSLGYYLTNMSDRQEVAQIFEEVGLSLDDNGEDYDGILTAIAARAVTLK